jgi:hypothetical protein
MCRKDQLSGVAKLELKDGSYPGDVTDLAEKLNELISLLKGEG